jgi:hypothetical protein
MKIVTITLETLWKNFMSGMADVMWCDASETGLSDIERVKSVLLPSTEVSSSMSFFEGVSTIELCRLFQDAYTVALLGDLMREVDTSPPTPVEIHVQDGDKTYVVPTLFVVF